MIRRNFLSSLIPRLILVTLVGRTCGFTSLSSSSIHGKLSVRSPLRVPFLQRRVGGDVSSLASRSDVTKSSRRRIVGLFLHPINEDDGSSSMSAPSPPPDGENDRDDDNGLMAKAMALKEQAKTAKLEAQRMDISYTLKKISDLEAKMGSGKLKKDECEDAERQILLLRERLAVARRERDSPSAPKKNQKETNETREDLMGEPNPIPMGLSGNNTALEDMSKVDSNATSVEVMGLGGLTSPLSGLNETQRKSAEKGYSELPEFIQDMIAKSVGLTDGKNASQVLRKLEEEGKLLSKDGIGFEIDAEEGDMFEVNLEIEENEMYFSAIFPADARRIELMPKDTDMDTFVSKVLSKKVFNPTEKPEALLGGFVIRGENRKENGDDLVRALDEAMGKTDLGERLQYFYVKDPLPLTDEELDRGGIPDSPVLYVAGVEMSPNTPVVVNAAVTSLGLGSALVFALGSFAFNDGVMAHLDDIVQTGDGDLSFLKDLATPLFFSIFFTQFMHEAAHLAVAWKYKFKTQSPVIIPSLKLPIMGCITPLKTSPPNLKSLFDFAISGPLTGMITSFIMLYIGLEKTLGMDASVLSYAPSLPVEFLKLSSLAGGLVEQILGSGIFLVPDPATAMIPLHPLAIAGFAGVLTNALNLLPIGRTDGGRISMSIFGRGLTRIFQSFILIVLLLSGFAGVDESYLFLSYALYVFFTQRENEIPCRNEVDELDFGRVLVAIATGVVVVLSLVPIQ